MKDKKYYERFFWIVYFLCTISVYFPKPTPLNYIINPTLLFLMMIITAHFWARSDYVICVTDESEERQ